MDNKISFWSFLKDHKVEIPIIQRDYAQGRKDEEDLRKKFLTDLRDALDGKLDGEEVLKLDFVYGSEDNSVVYPLDGQQRLTTLWLLHWYIAYKAKKIDEAKAVLGKFTYKTRDYSEEFCRKLSHFNIEDSSGVGVAKHIENQSWFRTNWKQDPTIQSMLNMLGGTSGNDGIENVFREADYEGYWGKLTNSDAPIVFYYLALEDFGLSDDLYVKMNARGKPLTDLENFKADLITYLRKEENVELYESISAKLDTVWTDIFWKNKSDENKIDEIYFAFLNRFFWNELFIAEKPGKKPGTKEDLICFKDGSEDESEEGKSQKSLEHLDKDYLSGYSGMGPYKFLDEEIPTTLFEHLQIVLDGYKAYMDLYENLKDRENPLHDLVSDDEWNSIPFPDILFPKWVRGDFEFIPEYRYGKNGEEISMLKPPSKRVIFYALCKYFTDEAKEAKTTKPPTKASFVALKQWMRVVCNLVSGRDTWGHILIREDSTAKKAIKHIERLDSQRVLEDLYRNQSPFGKAKSDLERQWNEEIIKAKKILDKDGKLSKYDGKSPVNEDEDKTWERIIIEAEEYAFFKGSIRFLYQGEDGEEDWDNFNKKWENAQKYFLEKPETRQSKEIWVENNSVDLLKALISLISSDDFESVLLNSQSFNNGDDSWIYYLLNQNICANIHQLLTLEVKDGRIPIKPRSYSGSFNEEAYEHTLYYLSQTQLLDVLVKVIPYSWIRWEDGSLVIRDKHSRKSSGQYVHLNTNKYDFLENVDVTKVEEYNKIEGTKFHFENSKICFEYKSLPYVRWSDRWIYLQNKSGLPMSDKKDTYHMERNPAAPEDSPERWYCFDTKGLNETQIMEKLDKLKNDYEEDMRKKAKADPPSNS